MTKKYRFKEGLEFEDCSLVGFPPPRETVRVYVGTRPTVVPVDFLEEVEPELSESERLPNGTVVRQAGGHVDPDIATKCDDGQWEVTGQQGCHSSLHWIDSGDYEILGPQSKARVFHGGDPEPGPEVQRVKSYSGKVFGRWRGGRDDGGYLWYCGDAGSKRWEELEIDTPLTDITNDPESVHR